MGKQFPLQAAVREVEIRDIFEKEAPSFPVGGPDDLSRFMRGYSEDAGTLIFTFLPPLSHYSFLCLPPAFPCTHRVGKIPN
jgi:hypothetical protein